MEDHELRSRVLKATLAEVAQDSGASPDSRRGALRLALADPAAASIVDEDFEADEDAARALFGRSLADWDAAGPKPPPEPEPPRPRARRTPAIPPEPYGGRPFDGFVSPEEYASTPWSVRQTEAFQRRVERSRRLWPDVVPASVFPCADSDPWR